MEARGRGQGVDGGHRHGGRRRATPMAWLVDGGVAGVGGSGRVGRFGSDAGCSRPVAYQNFLIKILMRCRRFSGGRFFRKKSPSAGYNLRRKRGERDLFATFAKKTMPYVTWILQEFHSHHALLQEHMDTLSPGALIWSIFWITIGVHKSNFL